MTIAGRTLVLLLAAGACAHDAPSAADAASGDAPGGDAAIAGATDYLLFAPTASTTTYLIDRAGQVVHTWASSARPGLAVELLDNGHLLRTELTPSTVFTGGGTGGRVVAYDWDGAVVWSYTYASATHHAHHDVAALPNGHVLLVAWEAIDLATARAAGRDPATLPATGALWADQIVEVDPATDEIVWTWRLWDHLVQDRVPTGAGYGVVAEHPERVDVNAAARAQSDWTHINAIAYEPALDQIVLSVHNLSELWIIDHGTTTAEAAGHTGGRRGRGGDLLYRHGNPAMHAAGGAADQTLFGQHDVHWIAPGLAGADNLLVFNNGNAMARAYSTVDELTPPRAADGSYGTAAAAAAWRYAATPPTAMFAPSISGAQRLPGGNTLVCVGPEGRFVEVSPAGAEVWSYVYPGATPGVFRVTSYPASHPALAGRDLTPSGPIAP